MMTVVVASGFRRSSEDLIFGRESGKFSLQPLIIRLEGIRGLFETGDFLFEFSDMAFFSFAESSLTFFFFFQL